MINNKYTLDFHSNFYLEIPNYLSDSLFALQFVKMKCCIQEFINNFCSRQLQIYSDECLIKKSYLIFSFLCTLFKQDKCLEAVEMVVREQSFQEV